MYSKSNFNTLSLVNCATASNGNPEFCYCNTCSENEGDCDSHDECQDCLTCGSNNCPSSLGLDAEADCCYNSTLVVVGDEDFCTTCNPCVHNQGDCDSNDECVNGNGCGSCLPSLGFNSNINCCTEEALDNGDWKFCTNNGPCGIDEG